jgi:hypothetical protein
MTSTRTTAPSTARYGTASQIAEHISATLFPISERAVRRDWRERHGLAFVVLNGQAMAEFAEAERIAKRIIRNAPAPVAYRPSGGEGLQL